MNLSKLQVKQVINASGKMSILGVSTVQDNVIEAMKYGAQSFFEMADLVKKSGEIVAEYFATESAIIVNSASSGIALSIAGLIAKDDRYASEKLYQIAPDRPNEVLILKGQNVDYGAPVETMINLGGGKLIEVGYSNGCKIDQIEGAITADTIAIFYVKSHHAVQKNMPSLQEIKELCNRHSLPLIIDAAAEGDLKQFSKIADLVIYSGSKAIDGPTSGIVAGKKKLIQYIELQSKIIGRVMKVGKETIFGILQALENYQTKEDDVEGQLETLETLKPLNNLPGVQVMTQQDGSGRAIYRGRIMIDEQITGISALQVIEKLKSGTIAIYTRDYYANVGHFDIDPRPLKDGDIDIITNRIKEIIGGVHS